MNDRQRNFLTALLKQDKKSPGVALAPQRIAFLAGVKGSRHIARGSSATMWALHARGYVIAVRSGDGPGHPLGATFFRISDKGKLEAGRG